MYVVDLYQSQDIVSRLEKYLRNFLNEKSHKFAISNTTQICICLAI